MAVSFEYLHTLPSLVPIPQLNCHVIGGGKDERLGRVYDDRSNVVGMSFEGGDLFGSIVIVDSQLEII